MRTQIHLSDFPNQITRYFKYYSYLKFVEITDDSGEILTCMLWNPNEREQSIPNLKDKEELALLCQDFDNQLINSKSLRVYQKIMVASSRLSFPLGLTKESKKYYIKYLKRYRKRAIDLLLENDFSYPFFKIPEIIFTDFNIDYVIEKAYKSQNTELQAYLLNYKRNMLKIDKLSAQSYTLKSVNPNSYRAIQRDWYLADVNKPVLTLAGYRGPHTKDLTFPTFASKKPITKVAKYFKASCSIINIPEGYKELEEYAFYYHYHLRKITIPQSMWLIGENAFVNCEQLKELSLGPRISIIQDSTFENCASLEKINIPENIRIIGNRAFTDCLSLGSVRIPNSVWMIGRDAFSNCISLEDVKLGNNVKIIKSGAFANCRNLNTIKLPASLKVIDQDAFDNSGIKRFSIDEDNPTFYVKNNVIYHKKTGEVVVYPADFQKTQSYPEPENPPILQPKKSVEQDPINDWILTEVDKENWKLSGYKGEKKPLITLPNKIGDKLITRIGKFKCTYSEKVAVLIISEGYEIIDYYAFAYLKFRSVTLPDSLNDLGKEAFKQCRYLEEIKLGKGIEEIKSETFLGCKSLKRITIPNNVRIISRGAFKNCQQLREVDLGSGVKIIEDEAFAQCPNIEKIYCASDPKVIGPSAFSNSILSDFMHED